MVFLRAISGTNENGGGREEMEGRIIGVGWGGGEGVRGEREPRRPGYLLQLFPPLINLYISVFPIYQYNTRHLVFKTVLIAGEFHVSGKKLHYV